LRFLSGKRLKSCLHRVVPLNPTEHRYSIAYFLRPESAVEFKDPEDRKVTAEEWHDNKYVMFAEPHGVQAKSQVLTGGMEEMLVAAGV
jgi:isopenicillin N synthase-like dioxygenase